MWFEGDKYFADTLDKGHKQADLPIFQQTKKLFTTVNGHRY